MIVEATRENVGELFDGVLVTIDEIFYKASKPGWKCRKCGWTCVTQGLPWRHDCQPADEEGE